MPRPNRPRSVFAEDNLARRIAVEREARGWSIDGLAKRMTEAGCPMTGSAIFKIEKGQPRRRIVFDEAIAFSQVFGTPLFELSVPPEFAEQQELTRLLVAYQEAVNDIYDARLAHADALSSLLGFLGESPVGLASFMELVDTPDGDGDRPLSVADLQTLLEHITADPEGLPKGHRQRLEADMAERSQEDDHGEH